MTYDLAAAFRFHMQAGRTATKAIALARADREAGKARYPGPVKPYAAVSWSADERGLAYLTDEAASGLREIGPVHEMNDTPIGHNGWYTDPYQDVFKDGSGLCYGVVYQLPAARDGTPRYVAGYVFGGTDGGPALDLFRFHDEARDAAYAADSMAEHAAEEEREYQTAWQAGNRWSEKGEELGKARKELREVLRERRAARGTDAFPALCKALARQIGDMIDAVTELRDERAKLASGDFDRLYFYPDERLKGAFNEGAGATILK